MTSAPIERNCPRVTLRSSRMKAFNADFFALLVTGFRTLHVLHVDKVITEKEVSTYAREC